MLYCAATLPVCGPSLPCGRRNSARVTRPHFPRLEPSLVRPSKHETPSKVLPGLDTGEVSIGPTLLCEVSTSPNSTTKQRGSVVHLFRAHPRQYLRGRNTSPRPRSPPFSLKAPKELHVCAHNQGPVTLFA